MVSRGPTLRHFRAVVHRKTATRPSSRRRAEKVEFLSIVNSCITNNTAGRRPNSSQNRTERAVRLLSSTGAVSSQHPRSTCYEDVANVLRGYRACRTCCEDVTRKLLPWNLGWLHWSHQPRPTGSLRSARPGSPWLRPITTLRRRSFEMRLDDVGLYLLQSTGRSVYTTVIMIHLHLSFERSVDPSVGRFFAVLYRLYIVSLGKYRSCAFCPTQI